VGALSGTVLVVDDDPMNRLLLRRGLEREGLAVELAGDGVEALERLAAPGIDIVLLDILMPRLDGHAVLARMRADAALRHLPVVVISALDEMDAVVRSIELGADDFLPKPFDPVLLRARIGAGLSRKLLHDLEQEYLEQVGLVADAAAAVEDGTFDAGSLDGVAARGDALGLLARVFQRMAREVRARERRLEQQVGALRIEIDRARAARRVAEITETEYFVDLQRKAADLRLGHRGET
jgi:two-component system, cell cycle response regulator